MRMSENINEIATALAKVQMEIKNPQANAVNPMYRSKYTTLDRVLETVLPVTSKYEIAVIQDTKTDMELEAVEISTTLIHSSGQYIEFDKLITPAYQLRKGGVREFSAQSIGIAVSYGRRYSLCSALGIFADSDSDGNEISNHEESSSKSNLSEAQIKRAYAIAKKNNLSNEKLAAGCKKMFSKELKELSTNEYNKLIATIEKTQ